jgi:hypothetical protein
MNAPTTPLKGPPIGASTSASGGAKHTNLDITPAIRFLKLLDPKMAGFTFQTFDDNQDRKNPELARVVQSQNRSQLPQLHALGAGVFIVVNKTDGKGRKKENITHVRAVFQEDDDGFDGAFPLEPSIVVETSPGHFHRYWLVADPGEWPADEPGCADFKHVMERMVESYGSDKGAKDISRVLRLPGFLHRKGKPHLVRIVAASGQRYSRAQIITAFPPVERAKKAHTGRTWTPSGDDEQRIRDALYTVDPDDRHVWLECGMAIKDHLGQAGRQLWDDWSKLSQKYEKSDQEQTWNSLKRNGITIATVFHYAKLAGWKDEHRGQSNGAKHVSGGTGNDADGGTKEPPRPLIRELPPADAFPIDALGDLLGSAARAIHERVQCPVAICG